ncbi:isoprenyl transferase [Urechidicola croceus]|uniref:Isoprenyl transferase n=1 Tax=Urechidicola croceus TaxID=1850246 RepID=A0A1D8P7W6_9FLAO|nr:isoprenyl transferase [Urechidicola croceus]AOW20641.1 di-trans,poly-cis-decaprenylcistransferase [Urechidicola croceus]
MDLLSQINSEKVPHHVAVIMDGNGRWAKQKGKPRVFGHKNGVKAVRETINAAGNAGVKALTLYAFSTENWNRPKAEVKTLMGLLLTSLKKEAKELIKNNIKLQVIGNHENIPTSVLNGLNKVIEQTKNNDALTLTIALSYGSREEIVNSFKNISKKIVNKQLEIEEIDENIINNHLYTFTLPDVDLMIRTSGEKRISNFLLWQIAYAELHFTNVLWPDFTKNDFYNAILEYQNRERRFGKTGEQIEKPNEI